MRLIDADVALQRFIEETEASGKNVIHINTIKRILQDIDTAYDVEKVLAELKKREKYLENAMKENHENGYRFSEEKAMNERVAIRYAIDIVKRGGAK